MKNLRDRATAVRLSVVAAAVVVAFWTIKGLLAGKLQVMRLAWRYDLLPLPAIPRIFDALLMPILVLGLYACYCVRMDERRSKMLERFANNLGMNGFLFLFLMIAAAFLNSNGDIWYLAAFLEIASGFHGFMVLVFGTQFLLAHDPPKQTIDILISAGLLWSLVAMALVGLIGGLLPGLFVGAAYAAATIISTALARWVGLPIVRWILQLKTTKAI